MTFRRFTSKNICINSLIVVAYLLFNTLFSELVPEHYVLVLLWLSCFYLHKKTRKFVVGFVPFIIYWVVYDSMRVVPNYTVSTVHIREPYFIEKEWFGIFYQQIKLIPSEFFAKVNYLVLDFLSGFFYINWVPVPLALGTYLYFKNKTLFIQFSLTFLLVNLVGFVIYYIYPAAPPWYVQKYGFDLHTNVPGDRAGLVRFDHLIGFPIFQNIYNKNANVLAAMPSLHSTYPLMVLFYGIKAKLKYVVNILFAVFCLGIWFSAVYSGHHYVIDVLAGILLTLVVVTCLEALLKNERIKSLLQSYIKII